MLSKVMGQKAFSNEARENMPYNLQTVSQETNVTTLLLSCSLAASEQVNRSFKQEANSWEIKAVCLNIMHY